MNDDMHVKLEIQIRLKMFYLEAKIPLNCFGIFMTTIRLRLEPIGDYFEEHSTIIGE